MSRTPKFEKRKTSKNRRINILSPLWNAASPIFEHLPLTDRKAENFLEYHDLLIILKSFGSVINNQTFGYFCLGFCYYIHNDFFFNLEQVKLLTVNADMWA